MNAAGIIPARYNSSRFPAKPLAIINGKSMIERVYNQALKCSNLNEVVVATDDDRIAEEVKSFGGKFIMTSVDHSSGTERCAEALHQLENSVDVVVNIQGDEPYIQVDQIDLILSCFDDESTQIATLVKPITDPAVLTDPNKVKVIRDVNDFAIYFSRQCIPFQQGVDPSNWASTFEYLKHIGMYAYRSETLLEISKLSPSKLEQAESLEQLRWIENGYRIKTAQTDTEALSVDTPEDLQKLNELNLED